METKVMLERIEPVVDICRKLEQKGCYITFNFNESTVNVIVKGNERRNIVAVNLVDCKKPLDIEKTVNKLTRIYNEEV